jgi:benzodiazapine receptor
MNNFFKLILSIIISFIPAVFGFLFHPGLSEESNWFGSLGKPGFYTELPLWIMAPVWIGLYFLTGISFFTVWKEGFKNLIVRNAFVIFIIQLLLNVSWTLVFFGAQSVEGGLILIVILWILVIITIMKFKKVSNTAALMLIPYLVWVSFALTLNLSIFILNK